MKQNIIQQLLVDVPNVKSKHMPNGSVNIIFTRWQTRFTNSIFLCKYLIEYVLV